MMVHIVLGGLEGLSEWLDEATDLIGTEIKTAIGQCHAVGIQTHVQLIHFLGTNSITDLFSDAVV
jgi:hypothetical protein